MAWIKAHLKKFGIAYLVAILAVIGSFAPKQPTMSPKVEPPKQEVNPGKKPSPLAQATEKKSDPQPSKEQVATAPTEAPALVWYKDPKWIISTPFTLLGLLLIFLLHRNFKKKLRKVEPKEEQAGEKAEETNKEGKEKKRKFFSPSTWHPYVQRVGYSILALVVINAVLYGLTISRVPEIWNWYAEHWIFFLAFNGGILAAIYFYYQKDDQGNYIPDIQQRAKLILWVIGILVITNLIGGFRSKKTDANQTVTNQPQVIKTTAKGHMYGPENLPAEVALKIIGSCESLGHPNGEPVHYEKDGKTLLKNKEGSPARGKYQIMPDHWETAKKMVPPLDLEVEKDYEAYALHLYNTTGTQHWEFDEDKGQGPACWGPKFLALGYKPNTETESVKVIEAPITDFSKSVPLPYGYFTFESREGDFMVRDQKGSIAHYYLDKGGEALPSPSTSLEFFSLNNRPIKVILTTSSQPILKNIASK